MKQELICIGCPMGCQLTAEVENGVVTSVTGNTCPRGDAYARRECVAPVRTVTGTVAIEGAALPVLPVRTNGEIPKTQVFDVARALRTVKVQAPSPSATWYCKTSAAPAWTWWPPRTWREPDPRRMSAKKETQAFSLRLFFACGSCMNRAKKRP